MGHADLNRWRLMADDMRSRGMSINRQAIELSKSLSTYFRWLEGSEPRMDEAIEVCVLHSMVCGSELTIARIGNEVASKLRSVLACTV